MNCKKCGTRIHKGDPSCPICGTVLLSSAQNAPDHTETAPISAPDEAPVSILEAALDAGKPVIANGDVPSQSPAPPVKKRSKKPLLLIGILFLAIVGTILALLPAGDQPGAQPSGEQTVYLMTESVTENIGGTSEIHHYAYDDAGRIVSYRYTYRYPDSYEIQDSGYAVSYTYDSDGKVAKAEFAYDETVIEAEYVYEDDRLVDIQCKDLADQLGYGQIHITCDSQGRLQTVDTLYISWEFTYHSNGTIRQVSKHFEYAYSSSSLGLSYDFFQVYDEAGNLIESATKFGDYSYRQLYSYNSRGRMTGTEVFQNGEATGKVAFDYTYTDGRLAGMVIRIETMSEGKQTEASITFVSDWVGNVCTLGMDDLEADTELLESLDIGHLKIVFELDDAGNLLDSKVYSDNEVTMSNRYAYQAFALPDSYVKHNYQATPLYLYFLFGDG